MQPVINLDDTVRVRQPRDAAEYRLGTVTDITYAPHTTYIRRLQLRFPTGEERTYSTGEITLCTREDDRAALVSAVTDACRSLRDACRIAHDYDERISAEILHLFMIIHGIAGTDLGITLDPLLLDASAPAEADDRSQP